MAIISFNNFQFVFGFSFDFSFNFKVQACSYSWFPASRVWTGDRLQVDRDLFVGWFQLMVQFRTGRGFQKNLGAAQWI